MLHGTWNKVGNDKSSNFRKLENLILCLENEAANDRLTGVKIFLFTDNSCAESAFHSVTSSSKTLFELVVRAKKLEMTHSLRLYVIHVLGKRMIQQGTDGLSCGNFVEGVMVGAHMLDFVTISHTAIHSSPLLLKWIQHWTNCPKLKPLSEKDWLWKGQALSPDMHTNSDGMYLPQEGLDDVYLWIPAPCLADVALEFLRKSIHKRPHNYHGFQKHDNYEDVCEWTIVPKTMTYLWRKNVLKTCDLSFYVDPGHPAWKTDMYESLLVAVYLPLLHCFPWTYR